MSDYQQIACDYAKAQAADSLMVMDWTYAETAKAAGVKIEANGNSPADFFYADVRRSVASTLAQEEEAAALEAFAPSIQTEIRKLAGLADATVEVVGGDFLIRRAT